MRDDEGETPVSDQELAMSIDDFQLMNLIKTRVPFLFLALESPSEEESESSRFEELIQVVDPSQLRPHLGRATKEFSDPIVLICRFGEISKKEANQLSVQYTNILYVEGGWKSLDLHKL